MPRLTELSGACASVCYADPTATISLRHIWDWLFQNAEYAVAMLLEYLETSLRSIRSTAIELTKSSGYLPFRVRLT